jgi:LCP family protein required for cell wall assembly
VAQVLLNPASFPTPTLTLPPALNIPATATATTAPALPTTATTDSSAASPPAATTAAPTLTAAPQATLDPAAAYRITDPRVMRILLLGIDQRKGFEEERAFRSDTMILVSIDPVRKTVGVINFPRDLWVTIPNVGQERINTAMRTGDLIAYPGGGGPALAMETIASNFGVRVDKYVVVNFNLFESVVNTLAPGGVEICVREVIDDPTYPDAGFGFIPVRFEPGCQRLDATRLLQYARTRKTQGGDFDRARRQQEAIDAVRQTVLSAGGIANFITQIPTLWNELSDNYRTNLTLDDIIRLGYLMNDIPRENIQYAVVDNNYVDLAKSPQGDDILIPYPSRIQELIQRILYPQVQLDQADLLARYQAENPPIRVYNGTDISGLAGKTREWLTARGIPIVDTGNDTDHGNQNTVIRDYGNNRYSALYLAQVLGLPVERIEPGTDGLAAEGIIIVVGPDIQPLLGGQ